VPWAIIDESDEVSLYYDDCFDVTLYAILPTRDDAEKLKELLEVRFYRKMKIVKVKITLYNEKGDVDE